MIKFTDIKGEEIVLFITPAQKYISVNHEILDYYINKKNNFCIYVTVNRTYKSLMKSFKENNIKTDKMFIIDAITPVTTGIKKSSNAIFIGSPESLTGISIAITSAVKSIPEEKRILFFDSVSTLVVYNKTDSVIKFSHFLVTKMKEWKVAGAIISLGKETDGKILAQLSQFCDKVVEVK